MGNLIQSIPVYRPLHQQQNPQAPVNTPTPVRRETIDITNPFPQTQKYSYIPAKPLSDPHTTPKGVRAHASKARLIHENIFQSIGNTVKSYADYAKYFYKAAFKGEGKDYNVGKINDLSIRAGSLGIAAVLATSKMFPFAKGMEFVGLGTWFASMAIWPHILGAPIKALYGVDINQKYIDSEGRKKYVYEDNLYRPMDIYRHVDVKGRTMSEDEYYKRYKTDYVYLDKVGDDLGIPRNIKNRNEATMNKMGQVAVQGKTLCMMTAGVMTPVVSSIVADALQTPLKNQLEKSRYNKAEAKMQNLEKQIDDLLRYDKKDLDKVMSAFDIKIDPKEQAKLDSLLTESGVLSPKQYKKLQRFIDSKFFGTGFHDSLRQAMTKGMDMTEPRVMINKEFKDSIKQITYDAFAEVQGKLSDEAKNLLPKNLLDYKGLTDQQMQELLSATYSENVNQIGFNSTKAWEQIVGKKVVEGFTSQKIKDLQPKQRAAVHQYNKIVQDVINQKVKSYFDSKRYFVIDKKEMQRIFNFAYTNNVLQNKLKEFERTSIQNISESMTAINWERVPKSYLKTLGFNKGEIAILASQDATTASKVVSKKFSEIVKDPERYKKAVEAMSKYAKTAVTKEEKAVIQLIGTSDKKGTLLKVKELMEAVATDNFGCDVKDVLSRHYRLRIAEIQRKYRNTIDSYVRPIKALDLFKEIRNEVKDILTKDSNGAMRKSHKDLYTFDKMTMEQAMDSLEEYLKDAVLQKNDINNWTTKFETEVPGGRRGMKHTLELVRSMANKMFGLLSGDTIAAINDPEFVKKCDVNNQVMRAIFLRIENTLTKGYTTEFNGFYKMIEDLSNGKTEYYDVLLGAIEEKRLHLSEEDYNNCKTILKMLSMDGKARPANYNVKDAVNGLAKKLDFHFSNRAIAQMSGKNITDFFTNAAQEIRARNKWAKLVYGLLGGTLAVSALTIAFMGKKNHFNKDKYEYINTPQGADK